MQENWQFQTWKSGEMPGGKDMRYYIDRTTTGDDNDTNRRTNESSCIKCFPTYNLKIILGNIYCKSIVWRSYLHPSFPSKSSASLTRYQCTFLTTVLAWNSQVLKSHEAEAQTEFNFHASTFLTATCCGLHIWSVKNLKPRALQILTENTQQR